mgnify:CR=1 FL=1
MGSRVLKAMRFLHSIAGTASYNDDFVSVNEIKHKIGTDERNIRSIVALLKNDVGIDIRSKRGPKGGYRLGQDVYDYLFGISYDGLSELKTTAMELVDDSQGSPKVKQELTDQINHVLPHQSAAGDDKGTNEKLKLWNDIDYVNYYQAARSIMLVHDIHLTELDDNYPRYVKIKYHNTKGLENLDVLSLAGYYRLNDHECHFIDSDPIVVLDLKRMKPRVIHLRFIRSTELVEEHQKEHWDYDFDDIYDRMKKMEFNDAVDAMWQEMIRTKYVSVRIAGNLPDQSFHKLQSVLGKSYQLRRGIKHFYVRRSLLPGLYYSDLEELSHSVHDTGNYAMSEEEINEHFVREYRRDDEVLIVAQENEVRSEMGGKRDE